MAWNNVKEKKGETKSTANKVVELRPSEEEASSEAAGEAKVKNESPKEKGKDLQSGMELLEIDFLLSVVENTKCNEPNDVTMRKLSVSELLRRKKQDQVDSHVLKVYAVDAEDFYGKDIQCAAIRELTKRTV